MLRTVVELSIEDVEVLLDSLGVPSEDDEQRKHAREKLEQAKEKMQKGSNAI